MLIGNRRDVMKLNKPGTLFLRAVGALLFVSIYSQNAYGLSITIDGVTLTPALGQTSINLEGTFGAPQPGLIEGLRIEPSSPGVTPRAFFVDFPNFKLLGMTDFALVGPRSSNPFLYPFNSHTITIEHTFSPFGTSVTGLAGVGMNGSYSNVNRFVIGGELRVAGLLNGNQINGVVQNNNFTPPLFIGGANQLIYHPADDIRFRVGDLPNHSCDNIIGNPTQFSCNVRELVFLQAGSPLTFRGDINVSFVNPDRFVFPGSIDFSFEVIPEPSSLLLFGSGLIGLRFLRKTKNDE
jgi:hypothetical protein